MSPKGAESRPHDFFNGLLGEYRLVPVASPPQGAYDRSSQKSGLAAAAKRCRPNLEMIAFPGHFPSDQAVLGSVMDAEALKREFVETYLTIARSKGTGTLKVFSAEQAKQVLFVDGFVAEIDTCRDDTVLEAALLHTEQYSERDLKKAQKVASRGQKTLGGALLELNTLVEDTVQESLREQIAAEICELFEWELEGLEFVEHESDERLEDFFCELGDYYEIYTDAEELCIEGARLRGDWALVQEHFGILNDVFYATPSSMGYFNARDSHPYEYAIISAVDSIRDAAEVIEACRLDPYAGLNTVRKMSQAGELELINPVQMYQLGLERVEAKDLEKAYRLFRRAQERGLDDFDLQLRLAQILENLGRQFEAIERYLSFAEKCREQGRLEEAVRSVRRVIKIDPDRLEVRKELLDLLIHLNRAEETRAEAMATAEKLAAIGEDKTALELLLHVRNRFPGDLRLQQALIQFAGRAGDNECLNAERKRLDEDFDLTENADAALETYQRMFCEGQDSPEVRLRLVELHRQQGQNDKALEHARGLLNLSKKRRIRDETLMVRLHQTVRELAPTDFRSNQWLVDHHLRCEEARAAIDILGGWIHALLETDPENHEIVAAYQKLLSVDNRLEHRWALADALDGLGRRKEWRRELRTIADLAVEKGDLPQADRAIEKILAATPFDLETLELRVRLGHNGDANATTPHARDAAWLAALKNDLQAALAMTARLPRDSALDAIILQRVGQLARQSGERDQAIEHFLAAAELQVQQRNSGLAEEAIAAVIAIDPSHQAAQDILARLQASTAPQASTPCAVAASDTANAPDRETKSVDVSGRPTAEPFSGTPAVKTTVSSITARLRRLKSGEGESGGRGKVVKAASAAEKLRAMKAAAKIDASGGVVTTKSAALQSAASRLKALSAGGNPGAEAEAGTPPADDGMQIAKKKKKKKKKNLRGAAEELAALHEEASNPATDITTPDSAADADLAADATPEPTGGDGGGEVTTQKATLGGAASRLAKLREQAKANA